MARDLAWHLVGFVPIDKTSTYTNNATAHPVKSSNTSDSVQIRYGNESHEQGNFTAYDAAIRQVWLVVTGFAQAGSDDAHPRGSAGQTGSVACLQADQVQNNSRDFKNAADIASSSLVHVLMGITVAVSLCW